MCIRDSIKTANPLFVCSPAPVKHDWKHADYFMWYQRSFSQLGVLTEHCRANACRHLANLCVLADEQLAAVPHAEKPEPVISSYIAVLRAIKTLEAEYGMIPKECKRAKGKLVRVSEQGVGEPGKRTQIDNLMADGD